MSRIGLTIIQSIEKSVSEADGSGIKLKHIADEWKKKAYAFPDYADKYKEIAKALFSIIESQKIKCDICNGSGKNQSPEWKDVPSEKGREFRVPDFILKARLLCPICNGEGVTEALSINKGVKL